MAMRTYDRDVLGGEVKVCSRISGEALSAKGIASASASVASRAYGTDDAMVEETNNHVLSLMDESMTSAGYFKLGSFLHVTRFALPRRIVALLVPRIH